MNDPSHRHPEPVLVGDHPSMDFLNSIENSEMPSSDCLRDGLGLVRWMELAGLIDGATATKMSRIDNGALDEIAAEARALREWLRSMHIAGRGIVIDNPDVQLAPLNAILARDNSFGCVVLDGYHEGDHPHFAVERTNRWDDPRELLQPIAAAIAQLLAEENLALVRTCEGPTCTLMFLDRTKSHKRRWCSMAVCGNRSKAAAHRARTSARSE
ncbi:CGNR zinc finger domain-containing protein [Rhizobium mayense]|uniref:CGNR zinc finger domain-containing protein n=1 Tax=Rhizobium mayense TaxID=1312184 RepID=A0ABT7K924_9HYPH|nr:CGNR zinc finger domain-containing protein [Rhizobium mayense]MDL2403639.1 CGNR zinc finger domain-containing protein [Rhizobium mayense]